MSLRKFLMEYVKSPRTVGAIAPSSAKLALNMVQDINFNEAKCIVEYGPGTGVFTDKIIERKKKNTLLILFERNKDFYMHLVEKYVGIDNIIIINDSAENVYKHLENIGIREVDYVISGLPFASLPLSISDTILERTKGILKNEGLFITFQYTLLKKGFIEGYFEKIEFKHVFINLPPAYVLKCKNQ